MDDKEPFLSRWSRRKLEAKEDATADSPAVVGVPPSAASLPAATQPPVPETEARNSAQYKEFFDPQVDENLRRTALKRLFGDPHFNVMDGLDTYIDDYSKPDPIPEAMLRQLNQAKDLFLFDEEDKASETAGDAASAVHGEPAPAAAADTGALPEALPASASDEPAGVATSTATAPPMQSVKNA